MTNLGPWRTADFESLSWHDVHVYGFHLESFNSEEGAADLKLDIDFILKWEQTEDGFLFTVCQAELIFHGVFGLKFMLDFSTPTAGMCPFTIDGIERVPLEFPRGYKSFHWRIPINWPSGIIEFDAPAFSQRLIGEPVVQPMQALQRGKGGGAMA
jgi:hypothetical protein